jgi:uncharacterized membrane protein YdjX (TVP38/TMEM64 family)
MTKTLMAFVVKPLVFTGAITLAFLALHYGWWGPVTEEDLLHRLFLHHWSVAWPVFGLVGVVYTAVGGPRQVLAFSCGYLMGGWQGALVSTLLTVAGSLLTMTVVRHFTGNWIRQRHAARVQALQQLLAQDTWLWICLLRLLPVGSNLATNILAGLAGLGLSEVALGSAIGYLPQMVMFSYAGSGLALHSSTQLWASLATLVVCTALGVYLYRSGLRERLAALRSAVPPS